MYFTVKGHSVLKYTSFSLTPFPLVVYISGLRILIVVKEIAALITAATVPTPKVIFPFPLTARVIIARKMETTRNIKVVMYYGMYHPPSAFCNNLLSNSVRYMKFHEKIMTNLVFTFMYIHVIPAVTIIAMAHTIRELAFSETKFVIIICVY